MQYLDLKGKEYTKIIIDINMKDAIGYFLGYIKRIFEYKAYRLKKGKYPFPTMFQIQTINTCNGSCLMCPNSKKNNQKVIKMSDELFNKITDEIIKKAKYSYVFLFLQNEPLMDDEIFGKIRKIKEKAKKKVFIGLISNGSLINDKKIKELEGSKIDTFSVSLDAINEETYKKIRQGLDYNQILKNIDKVIDSDYNKYFSVGFVIQKDNIDEFTEFKKFWREKGLSFNIQDLSNRTGDLDNYQEIIQKEKDAPLLEKLKILIFKKIIRFCPTPFTNFNILSNGDVILCCDDYDKKEIMGNVKDSSIEEIWNSNRYNTIREQIYKKEFHKVPTCKNCSFNKK